MFLKENNRHSFFILIFYTDIAFDLLRDKIHYRATEPNFLTSKILVSSFIFRYSVIETILLDL